MTLEVVEVAMNELHHSRYCGALLARPLYAEAAELCVFHKWPALFDRQPRDGRVDRFAWRADDLDPVIVAEFPPDGASSQIGLRLHKACSRMSKLGGHAHDRRRLVAVTVPAIADHRGPPNPGEMGDPC